MKLEWSESQRDEFLLVSACVEASGEPDLQASVEAAVARGVELMPRTVVDASRYFMCEWRAQHSLLRIQVTDETKNIDSPIRVELSLPGFQERSESQSSELVKFWITDYLSTCTDFLRFAVIALFHTGDRTRGVLL